MSPQQQQSNQINIAHQSPPSTSKSMANSSPPAVASSSSSVNGKASSSASKAKVNWKSGPPSCKECVRLKLKCSRSWPCTSCVRRGCSKICPTGTLAGRPSKDAAKVAALQKENDDLRTRLAMLEAHAAQSGGLHGEQHGRLPPSPLTMKSVATEEYTPFSAVSPDEGAEGGPLDHVDPDERDDNHLDTADGSGIGIMEVSREGAKYLGRGAGSLFVCEDNESTHPRLVFPFMATDRHILSSVHELFPTAQEAFEFLKVYDDFVEWMYHPVDRYAIGHILDGIYNAESIHEAVHHVPPHRLATVLMVFALGMVFTNRPMLQSTPLFNAASALLCVPERHFMVRHSLAAVETLHMMVSYLFNLGHSDGPKAAWQILGTCVRSACAIGLHRDSSEWGLSVEQQEHRRRLWWECATYDILQSLNFGRPYSTPRQLCDCRCPEMPPDGGATPNDSVFHVFKYRLGQAFIDVADYLAATVLPEYSEVVRIDSEIRRVEAAAPAWLKWSDFGESDAFPGLSQKHVIQQHSATMFFHKGLLMLHRPYFFKAVANGAEPLLGPYAASFTTCVTSARKHTRLVTSLLRRYPEAVYGWWYFLFHAFTAAVIQYTVLRRVSSSMMADDVRADFYASIDIMEQMSSRAALARRALPMLNRLKERIKRSSAKADSGAPSTAQTTPASCSDSNALLDMLFGLQGENMAAPTAHEGGVAFNPAAFPGSDLGLAGANAYGMDPSAPAYDTGLMLGFEQPAPMAAAPEQLSMTDPLIQTLLYWNAIANPDGPQGCPVPQM